MYCPLQGAIVCLYCPSACATMREGRLSHGLLLCQAALLRVPSWPSQGVVVCQVANRKVPLRAKLPITRCHCVPSCTSHGAIACQVAYHSVPGCPSQGAMCAKDAQCGTWVYQLSHRKVPSCARLPIAWCHCVPTLPIATYHCVPSFPSQGAISFQVSRGKPLCAKFPIPGAIACQVAHRKVPSCAMLPIARCHCILTLPIARCHRVARCPS